MKFLLLILFTLASYIIFSQCGPGETQIVGPTSTQTIQDNNSPGVEVDIINFSSTIPAGSTVTLKNLFWFFENPFCNSDITISSVPGNVIIYRFGTSPSFFGPGHISGSFNSNTFSFSDASDMTGIRFQIEEPSSCPDAGSSEFALNINGAICAILPCTSGSNTTSTLAICENETKTLSATTADGSWSIVSGGGTISGTIYTPANVTSNTNVTIRYTDDCGSTSDQTFTVNLNPGTASNTTSTAPICEGTPKSLVGSPSGGTWSIVSGAGSISGSTYNSGNISSNSIVTLRYTIAANGSCPGSSSDRTFTVTPESIAPTSISGTTTICNGASTTLTLVGGLSGTGGSAEWFTGSCGGTLSGTGSSITVSPTTTTSYFVRYTGTCNTTICASQLVTVNPLDDAGFSYSVGTFCLTGNNPTPSIAGLSGGTFSINNGGVINTSTGAINLLSSGIGNYIVTYLTNGPCPSSETVNISITSAPTAGFSYSGSPYCSNASNPIVTFNSGASGGVFSDQGSTGNLTINSSTGEIDLASSEPGTYTIENNIIAAGGCAAANSTTSVVIVQSDESVFSLSSGSACQNGSDITAIITGTTGGNFTSSPPGLSLNGITGSIDVSASIVNTYMVTYTTSGTCPDFSSESVIITTADDASFTLSSNSECQNGSDIVATITGITGGVFTTSPLTGLVFNTSTGGVDVNGSDAGVYALTYTTSGTCPESSTLSVNIGLDDDATFSYSGSTYCLTGSDPIPTIAGTLGGIFTSSPSGLVINGTTGEIDLSASSANTYDVMYTTSGTCTENLTVQVTVTSAPTAGFSYLGSPYCSNASNPTVTFNSGAIGGVFSDQGSTGNLTINSSTGEIDLALSEPGIYTIENSIVAANGCAAANATAIINITAQDNPSFSYTGISFCEGDLNAPATITGTTGGSFTSFPAGLTIDGLTGLVEIGTSTLDVNYTITYSTMGTCPDSKDVMFIVNTAPITPSVTTSVVGDEICVGESIDILASGSGSNITYNVYDAMTAGVLLGETDLSVSPLFTTDYYVEVLNQAGCSPINGRAQITVTVNSLPSLVVSSNENICLGDSVILTANGVGDYSWSTLETTETIKVSPTTVTQYYVTLTDANLCESIDSIFVNVMTLDGSTSAEDDAYSLNQGETTPLDVLFNDTYSGSSLNIIVEPFNGTATIETSGIITYESTDNFEGLDSLLYTICSDVCPNLCDTASVEITVEPNSDLLISGGFSPDGNGINDLFTIKGIEKYPSNTLSVFNRWGSLVYQSSPYTNDWDGKSSVKGVLIGEKLSTGTYFYILELDDETEAIRGSIEIKR